MLCLLIATESLAQERTIGGVRVEPTRSKDIWAAHMDGTPPAVVPLPDPLPPPGVSRAAKYIPNVPAYTWCYGCANTAAAIITGYYDRTGYPDLYTGTINAGVAPLQNELAWPDTLPNPVDGECPYAASHKGIAGRTTKGHVDDFWLVNGSASDPYLMAPTWAIHAPLDSTGDYMWTSWGQKANKDGDTQFFFSSVGSKVTDYAGDEPTKRDGAHGFRLWLNSRGTTVINCFNQLIYPPAPGRTNSFGFTYDNYKAEIDAGRPVILLCGNHTFVGYGYDTAGQQCYIRTTWDNDTSTAKRIIWGGSYGGQQMWAASCMQLASPPTKPDLQVKAPYDTGYSGNNTYNGTGSGQTASRPCKPGAKCVFYLQAQNDFTAADSFRVTGNGAAANWTVAYFDAASAGNDVTSSVTGAGWDFGPLAAAATRALRVEVTPGAALADGASLTLTINLRSQAAAAQLDTVVLTTRKYTSGVDPNVTPRNPGITAAINTDPTKADIKVTRSPDDPFGCTSYKLYRATTAKALTWVEIATISPTTGAATYTRQSTGLDLAANTYNFAVRAYNGAKLSSLVSCFLANPATTPRNPGLTASRVAGNLSAATLVIAKSPDDPDGCVSYQVQRHTSTPTAGTWADLLTFPAAGTATYPKQDSGLDIETGYQYRVRAVNGTKYSAWITADLKTPSTTPKPPTLIARRVAADLTQADMTISKSLDDPAGCTHYVLQRRVMTPSVGAWVKVGADIPATAKSAYAVHDTGLTAASNYQYQAIAYNTAKASTPAAAYLVNPGATPKAPTMVAVRYAGDPAKADIVITKSVDDPYSVTNYVLEQLCTTGDNLWTELKNFNSSGTPTYSLLDDRIKALESYRLRVKAYNGTKASPYATCDITDPYETVALPGYLHVSVTPGTSGTAVDAAWGKSPDDPAACDGYEMYVRTVTPLGDWLGPIVQSGSDGRAEYTINMPGFPAYTQFRFGIRSLNGADYSPMLLAELTTTPTSVKALTARAVALGTAAGGAQVVVSLAAEASVTADILNLAGRPIGRICADKASPAGSNVLLWDGRGTTGTRVPNGRYLVRVSARRADGQQAQVVVPLMMRR